MARNIIFAPGEYYHLYNRGTEKRRIFLSKADYRRFTALLYLSNGTNAVHFENIRRKERGSTLLNLQEIANIDRGESLVEIIAYCLMPNHFHLLVREKNAGGISIFMQKLSTAYTMYFNKKYDRSGALFQGRYKARRAKSDTHLKYLISYIHLNPVKLIEPKWKEAGIVNKDHAKNYVGSYPFSSFAEYSHTSPLMQLCTPDALPKYFDTPSDFQACVNEWLSYSTREQG